MQSNPAPASIEQEVRSLRKLQKDGGHAEVLSQLEPLLGGLPENRDLLLIEAVSLRHLLRINEALAALERMERLHPRFSRLHQERGMCHVALKDAPAAIDALLRAVNINPALPQSWSMLQGLYRLTGDAVNAQTCADHVATLKHLPPEVVTATALFSDGDLAPAEQIIRGFLLRHGDNPEAMRLLAKIGMAHDVLDDAELLLEAAVQLSPDHPPTRYDYGQALLQRHRYLAAREQAERLLASDPRNLDYRALAATAAVGLGEHDTAMALYRDMLVDAPDAPDVHLWLAHALKTVGRVSEAIDSYRAAAAKRPDFGDAYWSLANLKMYRFTDQEIERMQAEEASPTVAPVDRYHLCFALGKALEDRADAASSWLYYERGNALKRAESRYDPRVLEANTAQQIKICTKDFFQRRAGWGTASRDPIFILGLPRSGSTLLEQILASHSQVEGTQELSNIQSLVLELQGRDNDPADPRYPGALAEMSDEDFARLGERYIADTQVYRSDKPFFIDKMPNNFRHVGLIHLMLPNARIIDARRDPMSCCFSNLKQLFAQGQEFAYSIDDISRYYRTYLDLMQHWDKALPGRILRVQHQDVIDDLEGSVRRMLDYCDLPFETACIDFHKTRRSVRTPSSEQVRTPIFRDGLDQWKMYRPWLGPLEDALDGLQARYRNAD
jgi:predicted Zn-dependent protease